MKQKISDEIRKECLGHFDYEVRRMMEDIYLVNFKTGQIPNVVLVDFIVHTRILYKFFYDSGNGDKAHAEHYISNWKIKKPLKNMKKWNIQINNYLSHLSYNRVTGDAGWGYRLYSIDVLYNHFKELVIDFLNKLPEKYNSHELKKLLDDLKQEVMNRSFISN